MFAHFRPSEFLHIKFDAKELVVGYNILRHLYKENPTSDLAKMVQAMENKLFPKPKLILVGTHHLCEKCFTFLDVRRDAYHVRTDVNGVMTWIHQNCVALKLDSEKDL